MSNRRAPPERVMRARPRQMATRRAPARAAGSAGFAALLSGLFPGLGQMYDGRWVRGALMIIVPLVAIAFGGAVIAVADPVTTLVLRNASAFAYLVAGAFFTYHLYVVADAFVGKRRALGAFSLGRVLDYAVLAIVCASLVGLYGTVYRGYAPWANLAAKIFEPIANAPLIVAAGQEPLPAAWSGNERLNLLLLGVDARDDGTTRNTDTMMVLSLDPVNTTAAMLSVPRDIYIARPGVLVGKINAAYATGGPNLARRVVEDLLGIPINAYAVVDFDAFNRVVDSAGGVVVDVRLPTRDEAFPTSDYGVERIEIAPGPQLMDGPTALRYARTRHDSNDYSRARRQQQVLTALRIKLSEGDRFRTLPGLVEGIGRVVQTNMDPLTAVPLARFGSSLDGASIRSEVLYPCGGDYPHCELSYGGGDDGFYLMPDRAKVREFAAAVFYDPQVKAERASIEIRGAGKNGVATTIADRLSERAFNVSIVTSGSSSGRSAVLVRNNAKRYTANALAQQLGGLPVDALPAGEQSSADIVVRVGSDFRGLATDLGR